MRRSPAINSRGPTANVSPVPGRPTTTSTPRLAGISRPCSNARVFPTANDAGVDTVPVETLDLRIQIVSLEVERVGRPEVAGEFELRVE